MQTKNEYKKSKGRSLTRWSDNIRQKIGNYKEAQYRGFWNDLKEAYVQYHDSGS